MIQRLLVLAWSFIPALGLAYPDGAPPSHTGGFDEPDCSACHYSDPVQSRGLSLTGLEAGFEKGLKPGQTYTLQLRLLPEETAEVGVAGFQLSARFADSQEQAGELVALDDQQVMVSEGITWLTHQTPIPKSAEGGFVWTLQWTAPATSKAPFIFHGAAVVGNDDESPLGDQVYLLELEQSPGR